jgi:N-methylhydantoinase B
LRRDEARGTRPENHSDSGLVPRTSSPSYDMFVDICGGGLGAGVGYDGADATDNPVSNCSNTPVEALEVDHRFCRIIAYELLPDSGGAGQWRGGLGFRRVYEMLEDGVVFSSYSDRFETSAEGLFGGESGANGSYTLHRDGEATPLPMSLNIELRRGDVLECRFGGGGGYGDPAARDPLAVARDEREGKASPTS